MSRTRRKISACASCVRLQRRPATLLAIRRRVSSPDGASLEKTSMHKTRGASGPQGSGSEKGNAAVIDATQESSSSRTMNDFIADRLLEAADLLATHQDNPFRVAAYRRAAESVKALDLDVESILNEGGAEALDRIP